MRKIILIAAFVMMGSLIVAGQPRPVDKTNAPAAAKKPAPESFEAKYEGGMFGYSSKETGTLKFDDTNSRLVFYGADKKEKFSIPYDSLVVIYPESKSVTSTTGRVVSYIPVPGAGLAGLITSKRRYLVTQFNDPDSNVQGVMSFKLDNKELLESVIQTLGEKAKMLQRGDSYYRPRIVKRDI